MTVPRTFHHRRSAETPNDSGAAIAESASLRFLVSPHQVGPSTSSGYCLGGQRSRDRIFGGALLAQMLMASAQLAAPGHRPHSLHAHFLSAGAPTVAVDYVASELRRSRRFSTTRVDASQTGVLVATATTSFHAPEHSREHAPHPLVLDEQQIGALAQVRGGAIPTPDAPIRAPFDVRQALGLPSRSHDGRPLVGLWVRVREDLGTCQAVHCAALAWVSDFALTRVADLEHEGSPGTRQAASLDHAMWFHHPIQASQWLLYVVQSPVYREALAQSTGRFLTEDGTLIATVTQESLLRRR